VVPDSGRAGFAATDHGLCNDTLLHTDATTATQGAVAVRSPLVNFAVARAGLLVARLVLSEVGAFLAAESGDEAGGMTGTTLVTATASLVAGGPCSECRDLAVHGAGDGATFHRIGQVGTHGALERRRMDDLSSAGLDTVVGEGATGGVA
jgi:hypothetical protein